MVKEEQDLLDRNQQKLFTFIDKNFNKLQKKILDLSEIVVPQGNWDKYRAKVLRISNDIRRDIEQEVLDNYNLKFDPKTVYEDVIEVGSNTTSEDKEKGNVK